MVGRDGIYASMAAGALRSKREQHAWRELIRHHEFQLAEERRADMRGLRRGLDRQALQRQQANKDVRQAALLRAIQCGALITADRQYRHRALGDGQCACGQGAASLQHICWECDYTRRVWQNFAHEPPEDPVERQCGLPMQDRSKGYQDDLAEHMLQAWQLWSAQPVDQDEELQPVALRHFRCPRGLQWHQHGERMQLQEEEHRRYVRCAQCHFTVPYAQAEQLALMHAECMGPILPLGRGPLPKSIPPHVTLLPGLVGGPSRFYCRGCGEHDHVSQRGPLSWATCDLRKWLCDC